MVKKMSIAVKVFGWLVLSTGLILLLDLLSLFNFSLTPKFSLAIRLFFVFPSEILMFLPISNITLFNLLGFMLIISGIVCSVAILKLNNLARIICIWGGVACVAVAVFLILASRELTNKFYIASILIHISYIIFLTRPKVKEQFR